MSQQNPQRTRDIILLTGWGLAIIFAFLFLQQCGSGSCPDIKTISDTLTVQKWDSATKEISVPKPYPVPGATVIVEVPQDVDTAAILQKYFNKYYYEQTFSDTNLRATVKDTVTQNSIAHRTFTYQWIKPTSTTTIINKPVEVPKKRMALYAGGFAGASTIGDNAGFGPSLSLQTKKRTMYDINYDILLRRVEIGAKIKLQLHHE